MDYNIINKRLKTLKQLLSVDRFCPYVIFNLKDIQYLTGFLGSNACLMLFPEDIYLITDSRYIEYAKSIMPEEIIVFLQNKKISNDIENILSSHSCNKAYFQDSTITLSEFNEIKNYLPDIEVIAAEDMVYKLRIIKDSDEIKILRKAVSITDKCFSHLLSIIKPGVTEWDIVIEIEYFYKKNGCRKASFDPIVASGPGSSMPHYIPSMKKKIRKGEPVLIDMGCEFEGYNSDLTRTIFISSVSQKMKELFGIVKGAQQKAITGVKPGVLSKDIDGLARSYIADAGYGDYFGHSLGHGVGIDIHESPRVKENDDTVLAPGMAITIEPGIYIPELGGVRIEDVVVVTKNGCINLTKSSKEIIIL